MRRRPDRATGQPGCQKPPALSRARTSRGSGAIENAACAGAVSLAAASLEAGLFDEPPPKANSPIATTNARRADRTTQPSLPGQSSGGNLATDVLSANAADLVGQLVVVVALRAVEERDRSATREEDGRGRLGRVRADRRASGAVPGEDRARVVVVVLADLGLAAVVRARLGPRHVVPEEDQAA